MNRRNAIATLMALPATAMVSVGRGEPDDVIVIETDEFLSAEGMQGIKACLEKVWPGRRVVVLSRGMKLKIVSEAAT